jgi:23S rRNA (cytidine1920-2'-O)/16S rRNA (cytidine1409-2'-O)-methyltransferase
MSKNSAPRKQRLDRLLVERQLAESREKARRLIMAGDVLVDDQVSDKPGKNVPVDAEIRVRRSLAYVSRGGLKLEAALDAFALDVRGLTVVDVGASTGGFTDCLLQRGARRVYAVDVGYGQLAWSLRTDPRVVVLERTNIRYLEQLPPDENGTSVLADMATIDASFISLELVLPATLQLLQPDAQLVALIKPQFEAGRAAVGKGGVVRDAQVHRSVLQETVASAHELGLHTTGLIASPVVGPAGNVEFLVWWRRPHEPHDGPPVQRLIDAALAQAAAVKSGKET